MSARWAIARREIAGVLRERTILLAVVIQVFVAGFSSFLVVGLSALVDPDALPPGVDPVIAVNASSDVGRFLDARGLVTRPEPSDEAAERAFRDGRADAALLAEDEGEPSRPVRLRLLLPDGDFRATLTLVEVKTALEEFERALRAERSDRVAFEPLVVDSPAKTSSFAFVYSLLVPLLVFLPVVLAGALTADSLTEEVQRGTLPLLLASPATPADVVEGKLVANVLVAPALGAAWFLLLAANGLAVPVVGGALVLVLATAMSFLMGLLACGIALATRERNTAHVVYAAALFLLLTASLALPTSPANAVALLAAGSPSPGAHALVAASVAASVAGWLGLRWYIRRPSAWMAAGGS